MGQAWAAGDVQVGCTKGCAPCNTHANSVAWRMARTLGYGPVMLPPGGRPVMPPGGMTMGGGRNWIRVGAEVAVPWMAVVIDATAVQFILPAMIRERRASVRRAGT